MTLPDLGWIDWTLLGLLALSVLVGLMRGLVFELMSLVGWVVAYVLAQAYSSLLAPYLQIGNVGTALNQGAAFAVSFVLILLVWSLLARLLRMVIRATPLTVLDRLLGSAFGLLRGILLVLVVATAVAFTPAAQSADWKASRGAAWLGQILKAIKPMLPAEVAKHLPS